MGFRNPLTSLSATQITPGTLGAGVLLPAGQVSAGTLSALVKAQALVDGAVTAPAIAASAVGAVAIAATAIDGKVITGAIIRTAADHQRVQLGNDSDRVDFYSDERFTGETSPGYLRVGEDASGPIRPVVELATPEVGGTAATQSRLTGYGGNGFTDPQWAFDAPVAAPNLTGGKIDAPYARVHRAATQSAAAAWQPITWDAVDEDSGGMTAIGHTPIYAPVDGLYLLEATVSYSGTGNRYLAYRLGSAGTIIRLDNNDTADPELAGSDFVRMTAGQYVQVLTYSSTGGTVSPIGGSPRASLLWVRR